MGVSLSGALFAETKEILTSRPLAAPQNDKHRHVMSNEGETSGEDKTGSMLKDRGNRRTQMFRL
ncbi:MAG: hypothetical protein K2J31_07410, partial [Alistipes sp.]|nr:hypothetical protein [Alistipes sp.]